MKKCFWIFPVLLIGFLSSASASDIPSHPLLEQARQAKLERFNYALQHGAKIELTPDGKTFFLLWYPSSKVPGKPVPMFAGLHGHGSWAFDEFFLWHDALEKRGCGILAIQWWLGGDESAEGYLRPREIYKILDQTFHREGVQPGTVLLHGFSRGSANTYPVAALDTYTQNRYFALIIANSGKANADYPPVHEIIQGTYGEKPFEGTHWATFAGGKDPHPERDGIQGMREAGKFIEQYGGTVDLAIEDPSQGHGGFHRNPANTEKALDLFAQKLAENSPAN
ncbi:MAG: hypothetical protein EXS63_08980 [Candidatus Omnitrophica bacterium]|nr:hypothetical protein [Candidatus Omnitrophota bacterium]